MKLRFAGGNAAAGLLAVLMIGCGGDERNGAGGSLEVEGGLEAASSVAQNGSGAAAGVGGVAATPGAPGREEPGVVLFVGTSLTAGLGLAVEQSFPMVVSRRIEEAGLPFRVVNAGVSGETSAGALRRIDWLLQQHFDVLVLETGANDMLRGTDPDATERNIETIIERVRERRPNARILLTGMLALPNLGPQYARRFEAIYPRVAERNDVELIPFLLEGVAADRSLNQGDGIHPNAAGQRVVAENVWRVLEPVLREIVARR